jgi:hypothetical protein
VTPLEGMRVEITTRESGELGERVGKDRQLMFCFGFSAFQLSAPWPPSRRRCDLDCAQENECSGNAVKSPARVPDWAAVSKIDIFGARIMIEFDVYI